MDNPAHKAVNKIHSAATVAGVLGISRQAVNSWFGDAGAPVYLFRALSAASGVPLEEFLAFEEAKKGINHKALVKAFRNAVEDRSGT